MPQKMEFDNVITGSVNRSLQDLLRSGRIFSGRGKTGKVTITIPKMDVPPILVGGTNPCAEIPLGEPQQCVLPVPKRKKRKPRWDDLRTLDDDWES